MWSPLDRIYGNWQNNRLSHPDTNLCDENEFQQQHIFPLEQKILLSIPTEIILQYLFHME